MFNCFWLEHVLDLKSIDILKKKLSYFYSMSAIFQNILLCSSIFPALILAFRWQCSLSSWFKTLVIVRCVADLSCLYFKIEFGNVFPVFHVSVLLETACIIFLFKESLQFSKFLGSLLLIVLICFAITEMNLGIWRNNYWTTLIAYAIVVLLSVAALLKGGAIDKKYSLIFFALLVFHASNFIYVLFEDVIRDNALLFSSLQPLIIGLIVFLNLAFCMAFLKESSK